MQEREPQDRFPYLLGLPNHEGLCCVQGLYEQIGLDWFAYDYKVWTDDRLPAGNQSPQVMAIRGGFDEAALGDGLLEWGYQTEEHGGATYYRFFADDEARRRLSDAAPGSVAAYTEESVFSRIEGELRAVKQSVGDLADSIARLRSQLREVEIQADSQMQSRLSVLEERDRDFDPLEFDRYTRLQELTRLMEESLHDVTSIQQTLLKSMGETDAALLAQARTSRDVQQELMRMRAVPFANLDERLYRIVRQVARELDKKAELVIAPAIKTEGKTYQASQGVGMGTR